jgi:hypothetical protein
LQERALQKNFYFIFARVLISKNWIKELLYAKAIKISANEIIILVCAFGMDMQIPLSPL